MNENAQKRAEVVQRLRDYQAKVGVWIVRMWSATSEADFTTSSEYQAALDYYRNFKPADGVDYTAALDYARQLYDRYEERDDALDEKADAIIKYLGGGTALVTFGALVSLKVDNTYSCLVALVALIALIPSFYYAVQAVRTATLVRRPQPAATLPDIKFAVDIAEFHKNKENIELNLWLILHPICEAAHHRNIEKAKRLESAHRYYRQSIAYLVFPVIGIAVCLLGIIVSGRPAGLNQADSKSTPDGSAVSVKPK